MCSMSFFRDLEITVLVFMYNSVALRALLGSGRQSRPVCPAQKQDQVTKSPQEGVPGESSRGHEPGRGGVGEGLALPTRRPRSRRRFLEKRASGHQRDLSALSRMLSSGTARRMPWPEAQEPSARVTCGPFLLRLGNLTVPPAPRRAAAHAAEVRTTPG